MGEWFYSSTSQPRHYIYIYIIGDLHAPTDLYSGTIFQEAQRAPKSAWILRRRKQYCLHRERNADSWVVRTVALSLCQLGNTTLIS
jgi:hypothetical protein